uniref:Uncharacterized protein n=1 Tax=Mycena chlorophos TaxID=658473 RepID=A0ABQ0L253_MYCCL|nr:predicted protein [Mycena chlorophos]
MDPFARTIEWIKIWWMNSNLRLILAFHLEAIMTAGYMPLVTQSDPGVENFGIANGQTMLRQLHDPELSGTLQHCWMKHKKNVYPEIYWSQLRHRWTPGFEKILELNVVNEWYNPGNLLQALVFRLVFIPWLQRELNSYRQRINRFKKRSNKNKVLPHGVPNDIKKHPGAYSALDFKVLVPPEFHEQALKFYPNQKLPEADTTNVWNIYLDLLGRFESLDHIHRIPAEIDIKWGYALKIAADDYKEDFELIEGLGPLSEVGGYLSSVNNRRGLDQAQSAELDEMMNQDEPLPDGAVDNIALAE